MKHLTINCLFFAFLTAVGCKKNPGVGGNGELSGKVIVRKYNATFTTFLGSYPSADHYVYIKYGEHDGYDNRIKTDYNGNYRFQFLYPGKYEVFTYSLDSTGKSLSGIVPVKTDVTLKRNQKLVLSEIQIHE